MCDRLKKSWLQSQAHLRPTLPLARGELCLSCTSESFGKRPVESLWGAQGPRIEVPNPDAIEDPDDSCAPLLSV